MDYDVPLLKVQGYTEEELFRKDLLMLLPYYLVRYEKDCKEAGALGPGRQEEADRRIEGFLRGYETILRRLEEAYGEEKPYLVQTLTELIQGVAGYLAPQNEKRRVQEMGDGREILDAHTENVYDEKKLTHEIRKSDWEFYGKL